MGCCGLNFAFNERRGMTAFGASRALPFVSAKVLCLIAQRTFSQSGGNRSLCP